MTTYFAEIKNGIVVRVIVATQAQIDKNYSGIWIETKMDGSIRRRYAGPGHTYDQAKDKFIEPRPFPSWILDENDVWQAPNNTVIEHEIEIAEHLLRWDEDRLAWV